MLECTIGSLRASKHTLSLIVMLYDSDYTVAKQFKELLMLSSSSGLSNISIVEITPCVDIFAIFTYEPIYALSLTASHIMKECTINSLGELTRTSPALVTINCAALSFPAIKMTAFVMLNGILRIAEMELVGLGLRIDSSKGKVNMRISGLFTEMACRAC